MQLTIIPSDGFVSENGIGHLKLSWEGTPPNVHALQWDGSTGHVEFTDGTPNETISALPAWTDAALKAWEVANTPPPVPAPTPEEIQAQNKSQAESLLQATDWVNQPDVIDPARSPHLTNQAEFLDYRSAVRAIAVNPPSTRVTDWPTLPTEVWA